MKNFITLGHMFMPFFIKVEIFDKLGYMLQFFSTDSY